MREGGARLMIMQCLSTPPNLLRSGLAVRTDTHSGNSESNLCYLRRNLISLDCSIVNWPQNSPDYPECTGNRNEQSLKSCLHGSGEPDWWKPFPGCTSSEQCYETRFQK
jgi:hypothetical protein